MSEPTQAFVPPPVPPAAPRVELTPPMRKSQGLATASMVLGIISVIPCFWCICPACAVLAIVFGAVALSNVRNGSGAGEGMARAGLICGIVALVLLAGWCLFWAAVMPFAQHQRFFVHPPHFNLM